MRHAQARNVEYLRRRAGAARFGVKCVSYLVVTAVVIDKYGYYMVARLADIGVGFSLSIAVLERIISFCT